MELAPELLAALCGFAFLAGFIDSVVGGGGLIQVPALFVLLPQTAPVALLGTNKFVSIWGTAAAAVQYARRTPIEWRATLPTVAAALLAGFLGARAAALIPADGFRPLVLVMLLSVLAYTLWKKDLGALHTPRLGRSATIWAGLATGTLIGFYDGFLGPGTGSFLIFAFVGLFGFSFLAASVSAKLVNVTTNAAALAYFITHGHVRYELALPMAVFNVAGSIIGARLAIRRGSGFVRALFVVIVTILIARYAWDIAHLHAR
ncbi:sulfite exporter TauE/SafE family protein [Solimonas variicoloris]|uniref:sulfite exporter TauE/SafE family protein n=1 Tax=Solimonas variicoloris TaxID=254408 RepID=UPI00035ED329|nr:TSUP family transporter [Solimonas variicoloris]